MEIHIGKKREPNIPDMSIVVGDCVLVTHPDPDYWCAVIAAGYDAAYLVKRVDGDKLCLDIRFPALDELPYIERKEVTKTTRRPWWEEKEHKR